MQYQVLKKESQIEIRGFNCTIPQSYSQLDYVLPFRQTDDTVIFDTRTGIVFSECIKYISELDFLTYIYLIAKNADNINQVSGGLLKFSLDSQMLFCDGNSIMGAILPSESTEMIDCKSFFWNMLFTANFETKNLQTVKEFLGFIRAAISVLPRDIILFIEMGQLGKQIIERTAKRSVPNTVQNTEVQQSKKENINAELQTGNDFSDFLTAFENSSYEYDEDESEPVQIESYDDIQYEDVSRFLDSADAPAELINDIKAIDPETLIGLLKGLTKKEEQTGENDSESFNEDVFEDSLFGQVVDEEHTINKPILECEEKEVVLNEQIPEYREEVFDKPIPDHEEVLDELIPEYEEEILGEPIPGHEEILDEPIPEYEEEVFDESIPEYEEDTVLNEPIRGYSEDFKIKICEKSVSDSSDVKINLSKQNFNQSQKQQNKIEQIDVMPIVPSSVHRFNYAPAEKLPSAQAVPIYEDKFYLVSADGRNIPILKEKTVIGRGAQNIDLTVNDVFVSRVHAQIVKQDMNMYLIDMNPKNPSVLNDRPVESERPYLLNDEDRICFGKTRYYFRKIKIKR